MTLPLKHSRTIGALAKLLYEFLPGSGNKAWRGHVNFGTVASRAGVGEFWPGGSKLAAIQTLLELTLDTRRDRFEHLLVEIVRAGMTYRLKQGRPVRIDELDSINGYLMELGVSCSQLRDQALRDSLMASEGQRAEAAVSRAQTDAELRVKLKSRQVDLDALKNELEQLAMLADRAAAGRKLESLLTRLFNLFELRARSPFRVVGEEVDGSFELDHSVYLVEAKWQREPVSHSQLLVFHGKIEAKTHFTRGLFIALNDVSSEGREAIRQGKRPAFFVMNGYDLMMILTGAIDLVDYLRTRRRLLDEQGSVFVLFSEVRVSAEHA